MSGDILVVLGEWCYWHLLRRGQGCSKHLKWMGQPPSSTSITKIHLIQNVRCAEVEKPFEAINLPFSSSQFELGFHHLQPRVLTTTEWINILILNFLAVKEQTRMSYFLRRYTAMLSSNT